MNRRTALIFYFLSAYVIVQFIWWGYHIVQLTEDVGGNDVVVQKRIAMILGEGSVFLLILLIGIWQIRRSIKKDIALRKQQNNFLLSVTHELKTPIAANKLYLQTLKKREFDRDKTIHLIDKSLEENFRLEQLIDNILNASRLENKVFEVEKKEFDLSKLLRQIADRYNSIHEKNVVHYKGQESLRIKADPFIFETIINNLVENAIKYSGENPTITIQCSIIGNQVIVEVKDTGKGIDKAHRTAVFDKFYRIENEEVRTQKGTGLGLYIVKQLVNKIGGTIVCKPNNPQGTIFKISLNNDE